MLFCLMLTFIKNTKQVLLVISLLVCFTFVILTLWKSDCALCTSFQFNLSLYLHCISVICCTYSWNPLNSPIYSSASTWPSPFLSMSSRVSCIQTEVTMSVEGRNKAATTGALSLWAVKQERVASGRMSVSYQLGWHIDATESDADESKPPHSNSERTLAINVLKQSPPPWWQTTWTQQSVNATKWLLKALLCVHIISSVRTHAPIYVGQLYCSMGEDMHTDTHTERERPALAFCQAGERFTHHLRIIYRNGTSAVSQR